MYRVMKIQIHMNHPLFPWCDTITRKANNLDNATLFRMRQVMTAVTKEQEALTANEAAVMDGASKWQQARFITLPCLKNVVIMMFILNVGKVFYSDFGLFYQLPRDSGPLYPVTNVLDTYIFRALQTNGEIGMSSAAALFQSTVGFILIMIAYGIGYGPF